MSEDYQVTTFAKSLANKDSLNSFYQHDFYKSYALLFDELRRVIGKVTVIALFFFATKRSVSF